MKKSIEITKMAKSTEIHKRENLNNKLRKTTVFKKARELSTLCDVDVALILYDSGEQTPEIWSSRPDCVSVVNRYLSATNQPQIIESKSSYIDGLGIAGLKEFDSFLAGKIECVNQRIDFLRGGAECIDRIANDEAELNLDDVEFTFDDLEGFDLDNLDFGKCGDNQGKSEPQSESESELWSSLFADLDFVDNDFDWMKELDQLTGTTSYDQPNLPFAGITC
ncbi:hypothetical protein RND81_11G055500 [Saponaria officinalis]|uniref:MADS-box domain-containing protein n=1 Tax=Saponaria officinalis TaxID=3572 RepID=A0AAW1HIH9_SAPOF